VLIANRGEVASRIVRACKELSIETVLVHSEADSEAPWLNAADRTVCIGEAPADRSYLDAGAVLQAAEQTSCQAVHPGWGFLAENALFAERCEQQGIAFIGPSPLLIRTMGDKAAAKRAMAAAGLTTVPGSDGPLEDPEQACRESQRIGYPVLLKAVSGGGGRGMRRCEDESELLRAFPQASLEAQKTFGDPTLYVEKLIARGRHIEFQVLCDGNGGAIHLGERECSIQRKHQKLVEESPSPVVDARTRSDLGRKVAEVMAHSGYRSAGTVEFLLDSAGHFYFMEMNTRLQVEHPVTEMVTGVDLVLEQLRIACNEPLRLKQSQIRLSGHAIEFRINAEDPEDDFRPDPGLIRAFERPPERSGSAEIRWDSAIDGGYRIPPYYDSMLGKLIVHADEREQVLREAARALAALRIEGVHTTIPFHRRLLEAQEFRQGRYDVDYLPRSGLLEAGLWPR
jgi:acetyl-CoA carboxylase biotin carboxylase subunit